MWEAVQDMFMLKVFYCIKKYKDIQIISATKNPDRFYNVVNTEGTHKETLSANEEMGYEEMDFQVLAHLSYFTSQHECHYIANLRTYA